MPRIFRSLFASSALLAFAAAGCTAPPTAEIAITGVSIVQIDTGQTTANQMILISDGRIIDVLDAGPVNAEQVIDGQGRFAIPGLYDTHVHTIGSDGEQMMINQGLFIASGVTHVREMGTGLDTFIASHDVFTANADAPQPIWIAAGPILDNTTQRWYNQTVVASPEQAREVLPMLVDEGVDFFKVYSGLQPEPYQAILQEAARLGVPVDGHIPNAVGLTAMAEGTQRTFEHLAIDTFLSCSVEGTEWMSRVGAAKFGERGWEGYYEVGEQFWAAVDWSGCIDPALETYAARGGAFVPTLLMEVMSEERIDVDDAQMLGHRDWCMQNLDGINAADPAIRVRFEAANREAFDRVRASGVTILAGTDTQNYCLTPGLSLSWEMETMVEFGMTPGEVLRSATITPAEVFGHEGELGLIAPGFEAHVVLLDDNPLDGLEALRRPSGVFTQQRWYDEADLVALRDAARDEQHLALR